MLPYKIGAGFAAPNALNLSNTRINDRSLDVVISGTVYPTRRDTQFTFSLYLRGGYLLSAGKWFGGGLKQDESQNLIN